MSDTSQVMDPSRIFILGAGFNAEARGLAGSSKGNSVYIGEYEIDCRYPLLGDLPEVCFPGLGVPIESVEQRLADSIVEGEWTPVENLCDALQKADYYIATTLLGRSAPGNVYATFLDEFAESTFITFNYDSLLEFGLLRRGTWSPQGGFGVPVGFELGFTAKEFTPPVSEAVVLHPHGSLLVYTSDFQVSAPDGSGFRWLEMDEPAQFIFDPPSVGNLFHPYGRVTGGFGYSPRLADRVIAPVPAKAGGLRGEFVSAIERECHTRLQAADVAVAIGYAFAENDEDSYGPMLTALSTGGDSCLVVVSPEAERIAERLRSAYPCLRVVEEPLAFSEWVARGFPGTKSF